MSVMAQLGHTDPKFTLREFTLREFTLRVYSHLMRRNTAERAQLKALVYGGTEPVAAPESEPRPLLAA